MRKTMGLHTAVGLGLLALVFSTTSVSAQGGTTGKVTIESKSIAVGVGVSWGDGVLEYQGKKHPFTVTGLSVVDLGVSKVSARGEVKNLKKLEDFNGNYTGVSAGATVAGGGGGMALKNQNGVVLHLVGTTQGLKFKLGVDGVKITLKQ